MTYRGAHDVLDSIKKLLEDIDLGLFYRSGLLRTNCHSPFDVIDATGICLTIDSVGSG